MAASFPGHLERTMNHERKKNGYKAMKEMKSGKYKPDIDELEKQRQWHEPKFPCEGECNKDYCITTLRKYKGMCYRCRTKQKDKAKGKHYGEQEALNQGFVDASKSNMSDQDSDEETESEDEKTEPKTKAKAKGKDKDSDNSSDDSDYEGEGDEESEKEDEEEEKPKPKKKAKEPRRSKRQAAAPTTAASEHVADDTNFVVDDNEVDFEYEREDKRAPKTKLEEEAADLAHYTSLIQDKPKSSKRRRPQQESKGDDEVDEKHTHGPDGQSTPKEGGEPPKRKRRRVIIDVADEEEVKEPVVAPAAAAAPQPEPKISEWREDLEVLSDVASVKLDSIDWESSTPSQLLEQLADVQVQLVKAQVFLGTHLTRV